MIPIASLPARWFRFMRERFEPISTTILLASLAGANGLLALGALGAPPPPWPRALAGFALLWLVFFHMRLFDEIKDYEVDKLVNRERPLPRGLVTIEEHGWMTLACVALECALALALGFPVFSTWAALAAFTLVMRQEFFIGYWLSPRMELYAVTHTFSAALQGGLVFSVVSGLTLDAVPRAYAAAMLGNWFIFNVFEFGRKTFGREEEREGVDSYSLRLGAFGAFLLTAANLALGYGMLHLYAAHVGPARGLDLSPLKYAALGVTLIPCAAGLAYSAAPSAVGAKRYRGAVTLYLLAYHVAILAAGRNLL